MYYPPYRRRQHLKSLCFKMLGLCLLGTLCWTGFRVWQAERFDADRINAQTFLKEKKFDKKVQEASTPAGLPFLLLEDHETPIVGIGFLFEHAGSAYDDAERQGLTDLAVSVMPLGAGPYDRGQMSDLLELNGISVSLNADREDIKGLLVAPTAHLDKAAEALRLMLTDPRVSEDDLRQLKAQAVESLKLKKERPEGLLREAFRKAVYGNHPYARDPDGTAQGLQRVTRDDILQAVREKLTQNTLLIGVAGDLSAERAGRILDRIFSKLPVNAVARELTSPHLEVSAHDSKQIRYESAQIVTDFAALGTTRQASDFYPLYIANYIFGGSGLTSRLSMQAREKYALTYGIDTWLDTSENAPLLRGRFATTPDHYAQMRQIVQEEWIKFAQKGVTQEEFDAAVDYMLASYNLRFNSTGGLADMLTLMQKYRLGADFLSRRNEIIRALTPEEVNAAARKYFAVLPREISLGNFNTSEE